jgi:plasmid maintenance system antidote protein VapI
MIKNGMRPIHPGEILREEYLAPLGLSATALARARGHAGSHQRGCTRAAWDHRRQRFAPGALLRHRRPVLAEFQAAYDLRMAEIQTVCYP